MDIGRDDVRAAERLVGLDFTDAERELMLDGLRKLRDSYGRLRAVPLPNDVPPALAFLPARAPARWRDGRPEPQMPGGAATGDTERAADPGGAGVPPANEAGGTPAPPGEPPRPSDDDLAFASIAELGALLRRRALSARELAELSLDRLRRYDPTLRCVVTLTDKLALRLADAADAAFAAGRDAGPLQGIPWGAKDLLAVRGYPTTWGSAAYRDQVLDDDAAVVESLRRAGAVLVAKLSLGELAMGDVWFGGRTSNPWNLEEGSSGSSAGSAAAVAAGLVPFAIGSETRGSIVSPCTRCGVTGLRPTFGRVSRHGAMALSWSMDKLGPIGRSAEDCRLVFAAIAGRDPRDPTTVDAPARRDVAQPGLPRKAGYLKAAFEADREDAAWAANDQATLRALESLGFELVPVALPDVPAEAMDLILTVEAAAAFDELTRTNRDDILVRQTADAWPNRFRQARMVPAVEYVQANRVRTLAMRGMDRLFGDAGIEIYVAPSLVGDNLALTNLTGHPALVVPNGFNERGSPTSITFMANLHEEDVLLSVGAVYQNATDFHLRRPTLPGL